MDWKCIVCGTIDPNLEISTVQKKGLPTLVKYFEEFETQTELPDQGSVRIHKDCRKKIGNALSALSRKRKFDEINTEETTKITRSQLPAFAWTANCFFCGSPCEKDAKNPGRAVLREVRDEALKETVLQHYTEGGRKATISGTCGR